MPLMTLALPLMGNRLILNLLTGAEAVWIPNRLQMSGLSDAEAFSVYGILTGMALPFILFPSAITNSIAVLLLPSVAKDQLKAAQKVFPEVFPWRCATVSTWGSSASASLYCSDVH